MSEIYYEYRPHTVRLNRLKLKKREDCIGLNGFISVCGFRQEVADQLMEQNSTRGLHNLPLYLDRAILDFDDADDAYETSLEVCDQHGWSYRSYHTGNRGYHLYIDIVPYESVGAYKQLERWVAAHFQGYDNSLYKATAIIRIPGTIHRKTGKPMELVASVEGSLADITTAPIVVPIANAAKEYDGPRDSFYYSEMLTALLIKRAYAGERNSSIFNLATVAYKAGVREELIEELIVEWNTRYCKPPLGEQEITTAVESARKVVS